MAIRQGHISYTGNAHIQYLCVLLRKAVAIAQSGGQLKGFEFRSRQGGDSGHIKMHSSQLKRLNQGCV